MKKILILYFTGAGATKKVAELMHSYLSQKTDADIYSIEDYPNSDRKDYDALIIGTPVYHAAPADVVTDYFNSISPRTKAIPAFIYNVRAMWACNTNRILAKQIQGKNIITIMDREYRSPASDGVLLVPFIKCFFEFEKNLQPRIANDCNVFLKQLQEDNLKPCIPRFRFGCILNAPNKFAGQLLTLNIHHHRDNCVKCGKCIKNCPHSAWEKGADDYPVFIKRNCENCYRCIHHCPGKALSLSKHHPPKKLLTFK